MHISDGVLDGKTITLTSIGAVAAVAYGAKGLKEEEIPKISLLAATFFAGSLISIPIPPSSVHPILCGLLGILLGRRASLALFPALLLQALLFQHGGITSLGANLLLFYLPALLAHFLYFRTKKLSYFLRGFLAGVLATLFALFLLLGILYFSHSQFAQGEISILTVLFLSHIPLALLEGIVTGGAVSFIEKTKPQWIQGE
ncbi:cobalt transporter CbiM [Peptoniphilus sp. KCTC 25270]|uniref:cobalt transporter CbiM n=1 Tax=Peptoniphilus sp. KCTC 25270 TaxID=2897414 RepID=UPI001E5FB8D6|nr:cobalt transporter CbiM [Peptoniphilus sp. KCTC 25270]